MRHGSVGRWSGTGIVRGPAGGHYDRNGDLRSDGHPAFAGSSPDARHRNLIPSMNVNFPYQFDGRGRTLDPLNNYVTQLMGQVLFTAPGERVNMPDFGSGLLQLAFAPNSMEMAAATQFAVQGALQKWLGGAVKIQSVVASAQDSVLTVTVTYSLLPTDVTQVQTFVYPAST